LAIPPFRLLGIMGTTKGTKPRENLGVVNIEKKTCKVNHLMDPIL
jgi:hypothetical protein